MVECFAVLMEEGWRDYKGILYESKRERERERKGLKEARKPAHLA